jgi:murein DD-endopeptidase MepM/ murein hydrolase activator NlpD
LYCFVVIGLLYGASTTTKIKKSKKDLSATTSAKKQASRKLDTIAKDIQVAEKEIIGLEKKIDELGKDKDKTQKEYEVLKVELDKSQKDFTKISQELEQKRKAFITLLSEQFSIIFAMEQSHEPTRKSIISQEVYRAYKKHNAKVLASLRFEIIKLKKRKEDKLYLRNKTQNKIKKIVKKREAFAEKKLAKKKLLKKLSKDEEKYNAKLEKIADRQNSLRSTLTKLNILQKQEVEEARKLAAARKEAIRLEKERKRRIRKEKALARAKAKKAKEAMRLAKTKEAKKAAKLAEKEAEKEAQQVQRKAAKQSEKVRKINSSYQKSKVYAYKGGKTISPIPGARLIKKFGTYTDPIYKIKIFNESITLKAPSSNAKVQNVLNGKVVFAGKSSMLGKVVVVAHSGKIHTVYAGLSKIAPNIKTGRKIKKGYVIGKVSSKLMFQATKNSKHINPLKLIKI